MNNKRTQLFIDWFAWSLRFQDCDPAVWLTNYLHARFEHNSEQRFWFAWLYGNTYQLPTAWVLLNEFPDYELATVDRLNWWQSDNRKANYNRLRYQVDRNKSAKGKLPKMFASYQQLVGDNQGEFFAGKDFDQLWLELDKLYQFARYSKWFYLQHLKHTCGLNIEPSSLMLNDFTGTRSTRNGLLLALDSDVLSLDKRLPAAQYAGLESAARDILAETKRQYPTVAAQADLFTMETCLCSFKKLFRRKDGRYLGYYLDRQGEEITRAAADGWTGIDWNVLWQARNECLDKRLAASRKTDKKLYSHYLDNGVLYRGEWLNDKPEQPLGLDAFFS